MKRRTMIRTSAAAVGGGATVGALQLLAGETAAETDLTLDVVGDSATLDADDDLAAVWLDLSVDWSYDLPAGSNPDTVVVEIAAAENGDEPVVVDRAESSQLFASADGTESFSVDLLTEVLGDVAPDSGERATDVTIEAQLRVLGGGTELARETVSDVATLTIGRDAVDPDEYGQIGGSGSLNIEVA